MYSLHQSQTIVADDLDTIGSTKLPKELPEDRVHYHVCHQWPKSNGRQLIDPDGHNVGENPIKVDCNSGVTTLNHDHARLNVTVQPCDDLGCYSLDLQYESVIQAKAIVEKSSKCQQSIGVICQTAPLQFNGNNHGWWIDAEGFENCHNGFFASIYVKSLNLFFKAHRNISSMVTSKAITLANVGRAILALTMAIKWSVIVMQNFLKANLTLDTSLQWTSYPSLDFDMVQLSTIIHLYPFSSVPYNALG
jgi:hypothetical protein